ncbi:aspartate/glutamate racemase family protein [Pseudogracilibacillus sp. SO30301A]|uniref:aspartate/glutamate racemase family protein n=1 Tax=Pseudogracilibacillus sp. SO30301A TaxID=3098291 RepID=UPI00300E15DB
MRLETNNIVVTGPAVTGMHTAALRGERFSVLTITDNTIPSVYDLVDKAGLKDKFVSVKSVNISAIDLAKDRENTLDKLLHFGRQVLEEGADSIVLGCMSMGFLDIAEDMENELGIPVINPVKSALKITEALASINYTHSKRYTK